MGFQFRNLLDTKGEGSSTLEATINDFVHSVLFSRMHIDLSVKRVTMVMFHSALRDEDGLFINLNKQQASPGQIILNFIERFALSGKVLQLSDPMSFDFWIS